MNTAKALLVFLIAGLSLLLLPGSAVQASPARAPYNGTVVEVVNHMPSSWPVKTAVSGIDYYTGSHIHIVKHCTGKYDCVMIASYTLPAKVIGATGYCSNHDGPWVPSNIHKGWLMRKQLSYCQLRIDTRRTSNMHYGYGQKLWVLRHELGHWRGIAKHNHSCRDNMYYKDNCYGMRPGMSFSSGERAILRKH